MRATLKLLIFVVFLILTKIVYLVDGSYLMLPVSTLVIIGMFVYEFLLIRKAVKNGRAVSIGKRNRKKWVTLLNLLFGFVFFIAGLIEQYQPFSYWGAGSISYLGLIFIANALTSANNPVILFKERGQKRTYYCVEQQLAIFRKIEKLVFKNKELVVESKNGQFHYEFLDESQRTAIHDFLTNRSEDNIIINENAIIIENNNA